MIGLYRKQKGTSHNRLIRKFKFKRNFLKVSRISLAIMIVVLIISLI